MQSLPVVKQNTQAGLYITFDENTHPSLSSNAKFMNFYPFNDIKTISPRPCFSSQVIKHT
jgi:hypothetical protein